MNAICLDIEAADNGEMLELSIIRFADQEEIYHSYFKPSNTNSWPNSQQVHHISPSMVKNSPFFKKERGKVQNIIDEADAIIGFALANDIKYLKDSGIVIPESMSQVEVQNWFWYFKGKNLGILIDAVPRLSKCAESLQLDFDEETDAHSASNDTLMTIKVMKKILELQNIPTLDQCLIDRFNDMYGLEWEKHEEERAHGFISLIRTDKGFILRNNAMAPSDSCECHIEVKSRFIAEHELRRKFKNRETFPDSCTYRLKDADIKFFRNYTNVYDRDAEEFYRNIYNPRKAKKRRLDFRLS